MSLRAIAHAMAGAARWMARTARLAIGLPDYAGYVEHLRRAHPGTPPMSAEAFARERMEARYGRGRSRCC